MGLKDNSVVYLLRKVWQYSKGNRRNVVLYFVLSTLAQIIDSLYPLIIAVVLNIIQVSGLTDATFYPILGYLSLFFVVEIVFWALHGPARILENLNAFFVKAKYQKYLLDGTMSLPAEWHADHHSGDTIDKIEKGSEALFSFANNTYDVVEVIVKFTVAYIILAYFNSYSALIVLVMVFVTGFVIKKFDNVLVPKLKKLNHASNKISAKVFDILSNITTVIILRIEKLVSKSMYKQILKPYPTYERYTKIRELKWFAVSACTVTMLFLVLGSYLYTNLVAGTTILVGTVFVLYGYVNRINDLFFHMAWKYGEIIKRRTRVANAEEISVEFKEKAKIKEVKLKEWSWLKIKDLTFSYHSEEGADLHLDGINFDLKHGERIALIGHSGSGKTTFMKLIRDLYHPRGGQVMLDDQVLPNRFKSIAEGIALIPQDPEIFSTTVRENITLGVARTVDEIRKYTDLAQFTEIAQRLPKGLESSIVEKGVNLSGGEKQRLALARGLMASKDKDIVLLDEPTSSVDMRNEYLIYVNIFREFSDKAILSSIHRLHLLPLFDRIVFFSKGKILAQGTFEEMLQISPEFNDMWKKYVKSVMKKS